MLCKEVWRMGTMIILKQSHLNWLNVNWLSFHGLPNIKYKHYSEICNLCSCFLHIIFKVALSLISEDTKA